MCCRQKVSILKYKKLLQVNLKNQQNMNRYVIKEEIHVGKNIEKIFSLILNKLNWYCFLPINLTKTVNSWY